MTVHESAANAGVLLMRLALGCMLAAHGVNKVLGSGGIAGTARWFEALGLYPGKVHAWVAALTEIGAGVLMSLGLFFPGACAAFVGLMTVATLTDHKGKGFFVFNGGWEYTVLVAAVATACAFIGAGRWSLDWAFGIPFSGVGWGVAVLITGCVAGVGMVVLFRRLAPVGG
jgi:putative oxidoreductase